MNVDATRDAQDKRMAYLVAKFDALLRYMEPSERLKIMSRYQDGRRLCIYDVELEAVLTAYIGIAATQVCGLYVSVTL